MEPNDKDPFEGEGEPMSFEDLDKLAESGDLTRETLQEELQRYTKAYQQEFETSTKIDPDNVGEYTTDFFRKNVHQAAAQIVWLAANAESESVRGNMAKYVIEKATADSDREGNPIAALLKKLQEPVAEETK